MLIPVHLHLNPMVANDDADSERFRLSGNLLEGTGTRLLVETSPHSPPSSGIIFVLTLWHCYVVRKFGRPARTPNWINQCNAALMSPWTQRRKVINSSLKQQLSLFSNASVMTDFPSTGCDSSCLWRSSILPDSLHKNTTYLAPFVMEMVELPLHYLQKTKLAICQANCNKQQKTVSLSTPKNTSRILMAVLSTVFPKENTFFCGLQNVSNWIWNRLYIWQ